MYYKALNLLAQEGRLDETFEFERPSVVFQQITSICWAMMRFDKAPRREDIIFTLPGDLTNIVLDDMLRSGHIKLIGNRLVLSDDLVELGDKRQIHTVISGGRGVSVINTSTGETVAHMSRAPTNGKYFLDGHERQMTKGGVEAVYLEPGVKSGVHEIGKIPSSKRGRLGSSRTLIWEIAYRSGFDPREWFFERDRLICWGGNLYCGMLAIFSHLAGFGEHLVSNENSIIGFPKNHNFDKSKIEELAANPDSISRIGLDMMLLFNQGSGFFKYLSIDMKTEECRRAMPVSGFLAWIRECYYYRH